MGRSVKRAIIIFTLIVILCFGLIFFVVSNSFNNGDIAGNVVNDNTQIANTAQCTDSDGGIYSEIGGSAMVKRWWGNPTYADSCGQKGTRDESFLTEYYCDNGKLKYTSFECEQGCDEDACTSVLSNSIDKSQCYVQLDLSEKKNGEGSSFSLVDAVPIYGKYAHLMKEYDSDNPSPWKMQISDPLGKIKGEYALFTGRISVLESFNPENPGEIIISDSARHKIILPNFSPFFISITDAEENSIDLVSEPLNLKCERTCKIEGEDVKFPEEQCCAPLSPIDTGKGFVCTNCGDNICSENEDKWTCPGDCKL